MSSIFINQVTAHGEPQDVAALSEWLSEAARDYDIPDCCCEIGETHIGFQTASKHGPYLDLYETLRNDHPNLSITWSYSCDEEEVAGYLSEKNLGEWQDWLTSQPSSR